MTREIPAVLAHVVAIARYLFRPRPSRLRLSCQRVLVTSCCNSSLACCISSQRMPSPGGAGFHLRPIRFPLPVASNDRRQPISAWMCVNLIYLTNRQPRQTTYEPSSIRIRSIVLPTSARTERGRLYPSSRVQRGRRGHVGSAGKQLQPFAANIGYRPPSTRTPRVAPRDHTDKPTVWHNNSGNRRGSGS